MATTQPPVLDLCDFGVAFGERTILSKVSLSVPETGIVILLGPAGTGKSTLLRTIAGFNDSNPSLRTWGTAIYAGQPLGTGDQPALVSQSAKLMMSSVFENIVSGLPERSSLTPAQQRELVVRLLKGAGLGRLTDQLDEAVVRLPLSVQRHVATLRQVAAGPRMLCIDEPTTGLPEIECEPLLEYIHGESARRAILVVLHNQTQARRLGGDIVLLAGGVVQEAQTSEAFFVSPRSAAGREFLRMGTCCVASPDAAPEELDADVATPVARPAVERKVVNQSFGPRGFLWLKRGVLAGTPRAGIVYDLRYDLDALKRVGVTVLVSLTQTPVEEDIIGEYGIKCLRSPVPDMGAPDLEQATNLCQAMERMIAEDEVIAVHCRAGLGRTGTVLASYLIWEGMGALEALDTVRRIEPRWVQSEAQADFLEEFARHIANIRSSPNTERTRHIR
jgi:atypical dual specificity phosphatase